MIDLVLSAKQFWLETVLPMHFKLESLQPSPHLIIFENNNCFVKKVLTILNFKLVTALVR